jgi:mitochondrial enoyl-[acyl-carrier protein] reductase / trans-2-enoyl-CoA reductase
MVVANADHVHAVKDASTALALGPTSCTALRILSDFGSLKKGDWIVQNAANGAVGQAVIQIAKARGLKTINVVRGAVESGAIDSLKKLGGDIVVPEAYFMSTEYKRLVEKLPAPKLGINGVGGDSVTNVARSLGQGASLVTYGSVSRNAVTIPTSALVNKNLSLNGFSYASWAADTSSAQREAMINELSDLVSSNQLSLQASDKFKFGDFKKALDKALEGHYSNASSDYYEEKVVVTL